MKVTTMHDAIATYTHDGDVVAIEGFTACICFAAAHEIIRQGRRCMGERSLRRRGCAGGNHWAQG